MKLLSGLSPKKTKEKAITFTAVKNEQEKSNQTKKGRNQVAK